jgi:imidazole glycerol-phosphate synthase subunit HisF
MREKGLVKTVRFANDTYIGDPINAVRIYNEMEADELIFLDIDASRLGRGIDWDTLQEVANEAFMPVCYGGGVNAMAQAEKLFRIGMEKVSLSTAAALDPALVRQLADNFGSQSVVVTVDVLRTSKGLTVMTHGGTRSAGLTLTDAVQQAVDHGAGEILVNSIDRDGTMLGYDIPMLRAVTDLVRVPVIACGGCGSLGHMREAAEVTGVTGLAAGSLFVYWGRLKGILINYPKRQTLKQTFA